MSGDLSDSSSPFSEVESTIVLEPDDLASRYQAFTGQTWPISHKVSSERRNEFANPINLLLSQKSKALESLTYLDSYGSPSESVDEDYDDRNLSKEFESSESFCDF